MIAVGKVITSPLALVYNTYGSVLSFVYNTITTAIRGGTELRHCIKLYFQCGYHANNTSCAIVERSIHCVMARCWNVDSHGLQLPAGSAGLQKPNTVHIVLTLWAYNSPRHTAVELLLAYYYYTVYIGHTKISQTDNLGCGQCIGRFLLLCRDRHIRLRGQKTTAIVATCNRTIHTSASAHVHGLLIAVMDVHVYTSIYSMLSEIDTMAVTNVIWPNAEIRPQISKFRHG